MATNTGIFHDCSKISSMPIIGSWHMRTRIMSLKLEFTITGIIPT